MNEAMDDHRRSRAAAQLRAHTDRRMHEATALSIAEAATEDRIRRLRAIPLRVGSSTPGLRRV